MHLFCYLLATINLSKHATHQGYLTQRALALEGFSLVLKHNWFCIPRFVVVSHMPRLA